MAVRKRSPSCLTSFKLADRLDLLGPFDCVVRMMRKVILDNRNSLDPLHIRNAAELPRGNAIRLLFADACVGGYARSIKDSFDKFNFSLELDGVDAFASVLLKSFGRAMKSLTSTYSCASIKDPFDSNVSIRLK